MSDADLYATGKALPEIGSAVGGPVGGAVGSFFDTLITAFGGKEHKAAGGEPFKVAQSAFVNNMAMINSLYAQRGLQSPFPANPTPGKGGATSRQWQSTVMAILLSNPSLVTSDENKMVSYLNNGTYDAAIKAQSALLQTLQSASPTNTLPMASDVSENGVTASGASALGNVPWPTLALLGLGAILLSSL